MHQTHTDATDYYDARQVIDHSPWFAITCQGAEGPHTESCWTRNLLALSPDKTRLRIPLRSISPAWLNLRQDPRVQMVFVAESLVRHGGWGQELSVTGIARLEPPEKMEAWMTEYLPWVKGVVEVRELGYQPGFYDI